MKNSSLLKFWLMFGFLVPFLNGSVFLVVGALCLMPDSVSASNPRILVIFGFKALAVALFNFVMALIGARVSKVFIFHLVKFPELWK